MVGAAVSVAVGVSILLRAPATPASPIPIVGKLWANPPKITDQLGLTCVLVRPPLIGFLLIIDDAQSRVKKIMQNYCPPSAPHHELINEILTAEISFGSARCPCGRIPDPGPALWCPWLSPSTTISLSRPKLWTCCPHAADVPPKRNVRPSVHLRLHLRVFPSTPESVL